MIEVTIVGDKIVITHGSEKRKHKLVISAEKANSLMIVLGGAKEFLEDDHQFSPVVIDASD